MLAIKLNECEILSIDDLIAVNLSLVEALSTPPELGDKELHDALKQATMQYVQSIRNIKAWQRERDVKETLEHD